MTKIPSHPKKMGGSVSFYVDEDMKANMKSEIIKYILIVFGSVLYAIGTVLFIFPDSLLFEGTSGISVILNAYLPFSSGTILMAVNILILATDVLIVIVGGILSGWTILFASFIGLLIKTFAIDFVIVMIKKYKAGKVAK